MSAEFVSGGYSTRIKNLCNRQKSWYVAYSKKMSRSEENAVMILCAQRELPQFIPPPRFPYTARLSARGEPQRRNWEVTIKWRLSEGRIRGTNYFKSRWLSALLDMCIEYERHTLRCTRNPREHKVFKQPHRQLWLFYPPDLDRSLHNTLGRWCEHDNRMRFASSLI